MLNLLVQVGCNSQNNTQQYDVNTEIPTRSQLSTQRAKRKGKLLLGTITETTIIRKDLRLLLNHLINSVFKSNISIPKV